MENKKYWLTSGLLTITERFSSLIFGFGSFFLLVRTISKEDVGIWALFLSVTTLIEMARNGLVQNALIKYLTTSAPETRKDIITASLALNVLLTLVSVVILYGIAPVLASYWHSPVLASMFRYYTLTTIILIFFSQFNFIQQANFDFKGILVSNLLRQSLFFFYVLYLFVTKKAPNLVEMVNFQTFTAAIGTIGSVFFVRKYIEIAKKVDWKWVLKLFHYGKFVFGTNISSVFFKAADQMILGNLRSASDVGSYNTVARISNLFEVPITSIASIVFPQSAKRIHEEGVSAAKHLYEKSVAVMLALIVPAVLFVCILPKFILYVLSGSSYLDMAFVLQIVVIQNLFLPFLRQFGTILDSVGKPHINFYFLLVNAGLNILVNYFMISKFGIEGAAWGTLMVFAICTSFILFYMRKMYGISVPKILRDAVLMYPEMYKLVVAKLIKAK